MMIMDGAHAPEQVRRALRDRLLRVRVPRVGDAVREAPQHRHVVVSLGQRPRGLPPVVRPRHPARRVSARYNNEIMEGAHLLPKFFVRFGSL